MDNSQITNYLGKPMDVFLNKHSIYYICEKCQKVTIDDNYNEELIRLNVTTIHFICYPCYINNINIGIFNHKYKYFDYQGNRISMTKNYE